MLYPLKYFFAGLLIGQEMLCKEFEVLDKNVSLLKKINKSLNFIINSITQKYIVCRMPWIYLFISYIVQIVLHSQLYSLLSLMSDNRVLSF